MPVTCASPIISSNKQIRFQKNQCVKVKCLVRSMESFSYFVYSFFFFGGGVFHAAVSNAGCVALHSWMIENLPEGTEQNQEDLNNNCVSGEKITGHIRNQGQSKAARWEMASNLFRVHIPCFIIVMF